MIADDKKAILAALSVPNDGNPNEPPIGQYGAYWPWIKCGEYGAPALTMTDDEASKALNALIREGKVEIKVRRDDLEVRFFSA